MRVLGLLVSICLAVTLAACGDSAPDGSGRAEGAKLTKPEVEPPSGAPPKDLVVKDLEEGSGPEAKLGDTVTFHYVGVDENGKELYASWGKGFGPLTMELGDNSFEFEGLDEGIEGMQAGGRRELLIPADLGFGEPLFYVVDLLEIE